MLLMNMHPCLNIQLAKISRKIRVDRKRLIGQVSAESMKRNYMMVHMMDPELAVDDLKEI